MPTYRFQVCGDLLADGKNELWENGCVEGSGFYMTVFQDIANIIGHAVASHFQEALLHGPEAYEGEARVGGGADEVVLVIVHCPGHQLGVVAVEAFYVDADRRCVYDAGGSLPAMAQTEVDVGMSGDKGLAFVTILKVWRLCDAVVHTECPLQQLVG